MQIVSGYMFIFNIPDIQSVFTERSTRVSKCKTFVKPFPIFFIVFTDTVTLTHLLLSLESLLSVMLSFVFTFLLFALKKSVIW